MCVSLSYLINVRRVEKHLMDILVSLLRVQR